MKIVIAAARRTAIGSFLGAFADVSAVTLGITVAREVLRGVEGHDIADVLVGNVLQGGQGMNPARQIALGAGLPMSTPGQTINRVCGSGMQAVVSAVQAIRAGDGRLYLAGGVENMSQAPFLVQQMRRGQKLGDVGMIDSMVHDGLTDPTHRYHMGITAENVAAERHISRADQDAFALESHLRAALSQNSGVFDAEIVPVSTTSRKGTIVTTCDEGVRNDTSIDALAKLRPSFKSDGTVTAGNASSLNDGAAMLLISGAGYAQAHGLEPLAEIVSYACTGVDPALMGLGPSAAVPKALERARLGVDDIDLFELNEAFASQSLAVCRELRITQEKVNAFGGAIALGHPIGASGARILVTLAHALRSRQQTHGIASLGFGGGMGIAVVLRNGDAS